MSLGPGNPCRTIGERAPPKKTKARQRLQIGRIRSPRLCANGCKVHGRLLIPFPLNELLLVLLLLLLLASVYVRRSGTSGCISTSIRRQQHLVLCWLLTRPLAEPLSLVGGSRMYEQHLISITPYIRPRCCDSGSRRVPRRTDDGSSSHLLLAPLQRCQGQLQPHPGIAS